MWCLAFFVSDLIQLQVTSLVGNNLWIFIYIEPFEDALLLWALSYWQTRPLTRITLRIATPLFIADIFRKQMEGHPRAWIFTSAALANKTDRLFRAGRGLFKSNRQSIAKICTTSFGAAARTLVARSRTARAGSSPSTWQR